MTINDEFHYILYKVYIWLYFVIFYRLLIFFFVLFLRLQSVDFVSLEYQIIVIRRANFKKENVKINFVNAGSSRVLCTIQTYTKICEKTCAIQSREKQRCIRFLIQRTSHDENPSKFRTLIRDSFCPVFITRTYWSMY